MTEHKYILWRAEGMHIETQRLIIRNYTMDDVKDLYDILGDAEVMKNCEPAYSLEKTADFLSEFCIGKKGAIASVHDGNWTDIYFYGLFKDGWSIV